MTDAHSLNARLVATLSASGALTPEWRAAMLAVPRHLFVPPVVWDDADGGGFVARRRDDDMAGWLAAAYADEAIITQVDDGKVTNGRGRRVTSSISKPTIVAQMLAHLDTGLGHRVLEIGTGTGWNAALLAYRLGSDNVVSIEIDPALADRARRTLASAGHSPRVVTGDGAAGYPPGAPYDRVISTASVRDVPYAWVAQCRPGGVILTPTGTAYDNGALLRLIVQGDGSATGRFLDPTIAFMWLRAHRAVRPEPPAEIAGAWRSTTTLHPDAVAWDDLHATFTIGQLLSDVTTRFIDDDDGSDDFTFWAFAGRSWARVEVTGAGPHQVWQHGPRRLWEEIESAYAWWIAHGRPAATRYGLTVTSAGQRTWLDTPDNPLPRRLD